MEQFTLYASTALFIIDWILRVVFLFYVPRRRKPTAAMAWLLAIFIVPTAGVVAYLLLGNYKLSRRRRDRQNGIDHLIESATRNITDMPSDMSKSETQRFAPIIHQNEALGRFPAMHGNHLDIIDEYDDIIAAMIKDIESARRTVYLEYYAFVYDETTEPLFAALDRATQRGVSVYVLFDSFGTKRYDGHEKMRNELSRIGASWHAVLAPSLRPKSYNRLDLRNHRKFTIVDNTIAYIGSLNLISRDYQRGDNIAYDELTARITGPVAKQAAILFAGDWLSETDEALTDVLTYTPTNQPKAGSLAQLLPSGPSYEYENNLKLFVSLMYAAQKRIVITNPYLVPDEALYTAIITAAKRGVEVIVINSEAKDQWMVGHAQRSFYNELLDAGVTIYLHKAPMLLHSKHLTIDDDIAVIGSSNMDIRSFQLNMECVVVVYDKKTVASLQTIQQKNIKHSHKVNKKQWEARPVKDQLLDSIARLTASLQ